MITKLNEDVNNAWVESYTVGDLKKALAKYDNDIPLYEFAGNYAPHPVIVSVKENELKSMFGKGEKTVLMVLVERQ